MQTPCSTRYLSFLILLVFTLGCQSTNSQFITENSSSASESETEEFTVEEFGTDATQTSPDENNDSQNFQFAENYAAAPEPFSIPAPPAKDSLAPNLQEIFIDYADSILYVWGENKAIQYPTCIQLIAWDQAVEPCAEADLIQPDSEYGFEEIEFSAGVSTDLLYVFYQNPDDERDLSLLSYARFGPLFSRYQWYHVHGEDYPVGDEIIIGEIPMVADYPSQHTAEPTNEPGPLTTVPPRRPTNNSNQVSELEEPEGPTELELADPQDDSLEMPEDSIPGDNIPGDFLIELPIPQKINLDGFKLSASLSK